MAGHTVWEEPLLMSGCCLRIWEEKSRLDVITRRKSSSEPVASTCRGICSIS